MMRVCFTVYGDPQGKARPRVLRSGRSFTPKKTADYERAIRMAYIEARGGCTEHPVKVSVAAYYRIPQSASKAKRAAMLSNEILPAKKPDLDNVAKAVCDALNMVAYKDDAQVCVLHVEKYYAAEPMIVVAVSEIIQ